MHYVSSSRQQSIAERDNEPRDSFVDVNVVEERDQRIGELRSLLHIDRIMQSWWEFRNLFFGSVAYFCREFFDHRRNFGTASEACPLCSGPVSDLRKKKRIYLSTSKIVRCGTLTPVLLETRSISIPGASKSSNTHSSRPRHAALMRALSPYDANEKSNNVAGDPIWLQAVSRLKAFSRSRDWWPCSRQSPGARGATSRSLCGLQQRRWSRA